MMLNNKKKKNTWKRAEDESSQIEKQIKWTFFAVMSSFYCEDFIGLVNEVYEQKRSSSLKGEKISGIFIFE